MNGQGVLNSTLSEVQELQEKLPVQLEVGQPVLEEPIYIREASWKEGVFGEKKGAIQGVSKVCVLFAVKTHI